MNARQIAALLLLSAVWGASFLFIRIAAPVLGPFPLMAGRVILAAAALRLYAAVRRTPIVLAPYRKRLLVLGLVHSAIPFSLIALAEIHLTASMAAVLLAAQPLFAALIDGLWLGGSISARRLAGLGLGIAGVAVLMGWSPLSFDAVSIASIAAVLAASISYAAGSLYSRRKLADAPVMTLALGQQLASAAWLVVPATLALPRASVTPAALGSLAALALISTALGYLVFFWLIGEVGAVKTATVTYVIPLFGVLWGTLLLDEPLSGGMVAGLGCILVSLLLVNRRAPRTELTEGSAPSAPLACSPSR